MHENALFGSDLDPNLESVVSVNRAVLHYT